MTHGGRQRRLDARDRQDILDVVEIADSARKHGISDTSILHAWESAIKLAEFEYDGEERLLVIGPDSSGQPAGTRRDSGRRANSHHPRRPTTPEVLRRPVKAVIDDEDANQEGRDWPGVGRA